jgi:integrase
MTTTSLSQYHELDYSAIERADLRPTTKFKYRREIENLLRAGVNPLDFNALQEYAAGLKSSRQAFLRSALRLVSSEYEQALKAGATDKNIAKVQAGVYRLEAMHSAIKVEVKKVVKAHTWLTGAQVREITALCDGSLEGQRNWLILSLLLGAGLRRDELARLTFRNLKQVPRKNAVGFRDILEVEGKGAKSRDIPIQTLLAKRIRKWQTAIDAANNTYIVRSLGMGKQIGGSISEIAIFHICRKYGDRIGVDDLTPHDMRRTYARLGYEASVPITQISILLGHSSVATTQRYLDLSLDIETTVSDFIPLSGD